MSSPTPQPSRQPAPLASRWQRWRARWRSHLLTLGLVLAVFLGVQAWQTRAVPPTLDLSQNVQWLAADGSLHSGSLGQAVAAVRRARPGAEPGPVAIYIWAEWCPICRTMEGSITRLGQDWPVLTVAMQSGPPEAVLRYQQQRGLPWMSVIDTRAQLARTLGYRSVPAFVVLDTEGRLRYATVGFTTAPGMRLRLWLAHWL